VQFKLVVEFVRALPQHGCRGARNFRPDAVPRQKHYSLFHFHRNPHFTKIIVAAGLQTAGLYAVMD
jgi:hypothetical protein